MEKEGKNKTATKSLVSFRYSLLLDISSSTTGVLPSRATVLRPWTRLKSSLFSFKITFFLYYFFSHKSFKHLSAMFCNTIITF